MDSESVLKVWDGIWGPQIEGIMPLNHGIRWSGRSTHERKLF